MDWADSCAWNALTDVDLCKDTPSKRDVFAAALRKAMEYGEVKGERKGRASGLREAAEFVAAHVELPGTNQSGGVRVVEPRAPGSTNGMGYVDYFISRASQIEKGN